MSFKEHVAVAKVRLLDQRSNHQATVALVSQMIKRLKRTPGELEESTWDGHLCWVKRIKTKANQLFSFQLEASFTSNVAVIEANCERVEARVNALLEKFETKGR